MSVMVCKSPVRLHLINEKRLSMVSYYLIAILSGSSDVLMGVGKFDDTDGVSSESERHDKPGLLLTLREGDVVIHPAGTGHSNVRDEGDYRYLSFFPEVRFY